jgi:hypothetical protein
MNEYLTVYRGGRDQRAPRPFNEVEEKEITRLTFESDYQLEKELWQNQTHCRYQRLVQEAIERKRHYKNRYANVS